ncbi:MAG TPA: class I SAM-dependent methyltransferase [Ardenticatenaceae bacterium]
MARSQYADKFNHDEWAEGYDEDVRNEEHPLRAGYDAVLNWVVEKSATTADSVVLDLGCGTGNLSARLGAFKRLVCVDISENMLALAREKLGGREGVEFVRADLLGYFDGEDVPGFDAIVSTYAIHHLTEDEKALLFRKVESALRPGGVAAFGDLMFRDSAARDQLAERFREQGHTDVADDIEEEFFWFVTQADVLLGVLGLDTEVKRFSDLSWGIAAKKS